MTELRLNSSPFVTDESGEGHGTDTMLCSLSINIIEGPSVAPNILALAIKIQILMVAQRMAKQTIIFSFY